MQDAVHEHGWAVTGDDAYQALRGLRTLAVRLARHGENGLAIARWLAEQPQVLRVLHPALPDDPAHALWKRDYSGACGLFAVVLRPVADKAVEAFLNALQLFGLGFSWGGFESLAINCDPQFKRRKVPVDYGGPVVRLHVGLESPSDLIADLNGALSAYEAAARR
jgi:cystathionine beta-lyase